MQNIQVSIYFLRALRYNWLQNEKQHRKLTKTVDPLMRRKCTRLLCSVDRNELNCCARLEEHGKIGSCNNFFQSYGLDVPIKRVYGSQTQTHTRSRRWKESEREHRDTCMHEYTLTKSQTQPHRIGPQHHQYHECSSQWSFRPKSEIKEMNEWITNERKW